MHQGGAFHQVVVESEKSLEIIKLPQYAVKNFKKVQRQTKKGQPIDCDSKTLKAEIKPPAWTRSLPSLQS